MSIAIASLTSGGDTTDASSYASASITPGSNRIIVASYLALRNDSTEPTTPTVTGNGLTLTSQHSLYYNDATNQGKLFIFAADTGASPTSGAVTFSHGATTHVGAIWDIFEVTGTDLTSGGGASSLAACFVQFVDSTVNAAATSVSVTLAGAGDANNRPFFMNGHHQTSVVTPQTNWTEVAADHGITTPSIQLETQWRSDLYDTAATASWSGTVRRGGIAWEMKALVGSTRKLRVVTSPLRW